MAQQAAVKSTPVVLPKDFEAVIKDLRGQAKFGFSHPVDIPFNHESLVQYISSKIARETPYRLSRPITSDDVMTHWGSGGLVPIPSHPYESREPCFKLNDLQTLVEALFKKTMPSFVGEDGFYKLRGLGGISDQDRMNVHEWSSRKRGHLHFNHFEDGEPVAELEVILRSPEKFLPTLEGWVAKRPTITKGRIIGRVALPHVPVSHEMPDLVYGTSVSKAILKALLTDEGITLKKDDALIKSGFYRFESHDESLYIQVTNPTYERMKEAIGFYKQVEDYINTNVKPLQEVGENIEFAFRLSSKIDDLEQSYSSKSKHYEKAVQKGETREKPASIDEEVRGLNQEITKHLAEANKTLRQLPPGFPKELLAYASAYKNRLQFARS